MELIGENANDGSLFDLLVKSRNLGVGRMNSARPPTLLQGRDRRLAAP
jgi:hypothetical protein